MSVILFAIPLILYIPGLLIFRYRTVIKLGIAEDVIQEVFTYLWIALGAIFLALTVWLVSKFLCHDIPELGYTGAHGFWHVMMSYGILLLVQIITYVYSHAKGYQDTVLYTGNILAKMFPLVRDR